MHSKQQEMLLEHFERVLLFLIHLCRRVFITKYNCFMNMNVFFFFFHRYITKHLIYVTSEKSWFYFRSNLDASPPPPPPPPPASSRKYRDFQPREQISVYYSLI